MILASLIAMTLQSSEFAATCNVAFTVNRTYADDIVVACNAVEDNEGAEAEALRQVSWERDYSDHLIRRNGDRIETTLELYGDRTTNGIEWWGSSQMLLRINPDFPINGRSARAVASCIVRYNIRNGFARVQGSNCNARELPDAFGRASRNSVRRSVFSDGRDVDCATISIAFLFDRGDEPDWPAEPPCDSED
jgi:hypothetical protein